MRSFEELKPTEEELAELTKRIENGIELVPGVDDRLIEIYRAQTTEFPDAEQGEMSKEDKVALSILTSNLDLLTPLIENLQTSVPAADADPSKFLTNLFMLSEGITDAVVRYNENRKQRALGADDSASIQLNNAVFAQIFKYFPIQLKNSQMQYLKSLQAGMTALSDMMIGEQFPSRFERLIASADWSDDRINQAAQFCNSMHMMLLKFNNNYPLSEQDFKPVDCKDHLDKFMTRFYQFKNLLEVFPLDEKSKTAEMLRQSITQYVELFEPSTPTPKATIFSALWGGKKEEKEEQGDKAARAAKLLNAMQDQITDYRAENPNAQLPCYMQQVIWTIRGTRPPEVTFDQYSKLKSQSGL